MASEGPAAGRVREFAQQLAGRLAPLPLRLVDERLSTVTAEAVLRESRVPVLLVRAGTGAPSTAREKKTRAPAGAAARERTAKSAD